MKTLDDDYQLIPMSEITDEAREIAVRWGDNMKDDFIAQKHKLASDIMNYARRYHAQFEISDEEIYRQILIHLDSLDYAGGYPANYKETLSKHLGEFIRSQIKGK